MLEKTDRELLKSIAEDPRLILEEYTLIRVSKKRCALVITGQDQKTGETQSCCHLIHYKNLIPLVEKIQEHLLHPEAAVRWSIDL